MNVHLLQNFSCPKAALTTALYQRTPPLPTHERRTWGDSQENTWWMEIWSRIWENQTVLFSSQVCLWLFWETWNYKLQRHQLTARWQLDTFLLWDYTGLFCFIHPGTHYLHWFVKSELNVIIKCGLQNSISTCNTSLSDLLCAISK